MKRAGIILAVLMVFGTSIGCKSPDQIEQDVQNSKSAQEIIIKQELEREVRTLSVTGTGKVDATPDVATVALSVSVIDATVEEAQLKNNEQMSAVLAAMKARGIQDKDIKTQEVTIFPIHDNEKAPNEITGYTASNTITIRLYKVADTGEVITEAMQAGANELLHVEFHLLDETQAYQKALSAAVNSAQEKAEIMAAALGVSLNGPGAVVENINAAPEYSGVVSYETLPATEQITSIVTAPLQAGQITVTAEVTVEYMLKYPAAPAPVPAG